jgi:hypothetical protein
MPSADGRTLLPHYSFTTCPLELYHEGVDNGGWVLMLYQVHGGFEKLTSHKLLFAALLPALPCQHGQAAGTSSRDIQHGLAAMTCSVDMQNEHAPWICSKDMQHEYVDGHVAGTFGMEMHHK